MCVDRCADRKLNYNDQSAAVGDFRNLLHDAVGRLTTAPNVARVSLFAAEVMHSTALLSQLPV